MKLYQYMNDKAKHKGENRLLKFTILIIGTVTLINTGVMLKALSYQRVVIMPPGLQEKTTIEGNKLDEIYVSTFVRYISSLAFSYTPASARRQFDELLLHFDPSAYPQGKTTFYNLAEKIAETQLTQVFYITKITVNTETKKIDIEGTKRQYIDDRKIEDDKKTYYIDYTILNGRFFILSITESAAEPAQQTQQTQDKIAAQKGK
ncbi:MAG: type IV conjugative transfer system protein TraE [Smithella sp.]